MSTIKAVGRVVLFGMIAHIMFQAAVFADEAGCYELKIDAPIKTWDEAIPLGNGMLGGLLWGAGHTINLSLDRGDLWDGHPVRRLSYSFFGSTPEKLVSLLLVSGFK